ncbi:MAG: PAS domain-containing sensor histidine kinase [Alphaproteobacteria bacterium]
MQAAEAYLIEHRNTITGDATAMAADLNRQAPQLLLDPLALTKVLEAQVAFRALNEAMIIDPSNGAIIARAGFAFSTQLEAMSGNDIERAMSGEVAILTGENDDRVRALVRLDNLGGVLLSIGRFVDPSVLAHIQRTRVSVKTYDTLETERTHFEIFFILIFAVISLLVLLAAILAGLFLANRLVRPIGYLISASRDVAMGNLSVRVPTVQGSDEIGILSRAFNRMTDRLQSQQHELIEANTQLDFRRRFTEAVLEGVSVGVVGLDQDGCIDLPNRVASSLLEIDLVAMHGQKLERIIPELKGALHEARQRGGRGGFEKQIVLSRQSGQRTFFVRITTEREDGTVKGYVATFDDITELLSAQRIAAWADVARRLAHEIKNPLTPIQLSAERLKRKYLKQISEDTDAFTTCTDTIVRHVGDIGRMIDEFSAFARMPTATMKLDDLSEVVRQSVFLQRVAHTGITFDVIFPPEPVSLWCDARQLRQALTNLIQNAIDSIEGREGDNLPAGRITATVIMDATTATLVLEDNGKGFPQIGRERLMEPYVTTRTKGTGLGLAIVKKIMEDHNGTLTLDDRPGGGARIVLHFLSRLKATTDKDIPESEKKINFHGA